MNHHRNKLVPTPPGPHPSDFGYRSAQSRVPSDPADAGVEAGAVGVRGAAVWGTVCLAALALAAAVSAVFAAYGTGGLVAALSLVFLLATLAIAGAIGGIVLFWVGLARGRRRLWLAGLIVGSAAFVAMIAAIAWAIRADSLAQG